MPTLASFAARILLGCLLVCGVLGGVRDGNFGAAPSHPDESAPGNSKPPRSKRSTYPFSGQLASHDARSITLAGKRKQRVLLVTPATRVLRNGAKASLETAAPDEFVSGSATKNGEGKEQALTINLKGARPKKADPK